MLHLVLRSFRYKFAAGSVASKTDWSRDAVCRLSKTFNNFRCSWARSCIHVSSSICWRLLFLWSRLDCRWLCHMECFLLRQFEWLFLSRWTHRWMVVWNETLDYWVKSAVLLVFCRCPHILPWLGGCLRAWRFRIRLWGSTRSW